MADVGMRELVVLRRRRADEIDIDECREMLTVIGDAAADPAP